MGAKEPKFKVGQVVRGPYANDYRKIFKRRFNYDRFEYVIDRTPNTFPVWYEEKLLHPLTLRERMSFALICKKCRKSVGTLYGGLCYDCDRKRKP